MTPEEAIDALQSFINEVSREDLLNLLFCSLQRQGIPWVKYDPEIPPGLEEGKTYFVSDGLHADIGWLMNSWDEEPPTWCTPDRSDIYAPSITHYAPINLPREE